MAEIKIAAAHVKQLRLQLKESLLLIDILANNLRMTNNNGKKQKYITRF